MLITSTPPPVEEMSSRITVNVTPTTKLALFVRATQEGTTVSALVRKWINAGLRV